MAENRAFDDLAQKIDELSRVATQLCNHGHYQEALAHAAQARDLALRHFGQEHPYYVRSLNGLARLYQTTGDPAAAVRLSRQALEIRCTAVGEIGADYDDQSRADQTAALHLYRKALEVRTALGEGHPDYATSLNNLARLYQEAGNHAAALPVYRQALEIRRTALGENHPDYAQSLSSLAHCTRRWVTTPPLCPSTARRWRSAAPHWARTTPTSPPA